MEEYLIQIKDYTIELIKEFGLGQGWAVFLQSTIAVVCILIFAWFIDKMATLLMRRLLPKVVGKTKNKWDDIFLENKVFAKFAHYLPGIAMVYLNPLVSSQGFQGVIMNLIKVYFVIVTLIFINSLIDAVGDIYAKIKRQKVAGIKIYLQLLKVLLLSLGAIWVISIFASKNFMEILKGLGAMATILLIVYKDTIMGFVAGIQLSANKMVKVGDWVSIPQDNADGTVIDITLNTVKVQNWDQTITTVPTYSLMSESFTNWKGMEQSGGRRIKRSVNIDMDSIRFLSKEEIEYYKRFELLVDYISEKEEEINKINEGVTEYVNQKRLTNIGTFRKYIENYLKQTNYPNLNMTFIVRQLQSTEKGVPIEIYFFSKEKAWEKYEGVQSDIFDHIFAMVPEFDLRIFQTPTSNSILKLVRTQESLQNKI
ncbi:miniconductance mechanosensitive channel [Balneicella halophila]|uniref:Miniconductance mechanosensitive channel n=1 Tax=Balneicella halophila TaxID=1537566 RepID=A0A7L4UPH5_BALHA|nr:mechanosensitive ion channel domain-containing protein [Balneicella halophila]PVX51031.1 miniconductance mechanosensitive channel [Balneicella halophila]